MTALAVVIAVAGCAGALDRRAAADATAPAPPPAVDRCAAPTWVAAWASPPQDSTATEPPRPRSGETATTPQTFANQTVRMVVAPRTAGSRLRLQLSNRFTGSPLRLGRVRVARHAGAGASLPGTSHLVTMGGATAITVPARGSVTTDEVRMDVKAFDELTISLHVVGPAPLDLHLYALETTFLTAAGAGDHTGDAGVAAFTGRIGSTLVVSGLDVLAPRRAGTVVVLGDSLTDGLGSTEERDRRWPDQLARRAAVEPGAPVLSFVNAGISGNQLTADNAGRSSDQRSGMGPSAVSRLEPDVLSRAGVTDVVVFAGINDLYAPVAGDPVAAIVAAHEAIAARARAAGLRVVGVTLTPGGLGPEREAQRQAVNAWIRAGGSHDAVLDFDAVVRDGHDPSKVRADLAVDPVHLNDRGYAALAAEVDLGTFEGTGCRSIGRLGSGLLSPAGQRTMRRFR